MPKPEMSVEVSKFNMVQLLGSDVKPEAEFAKEMTWNKSHRHVKGSRVERNVF